MKYEYPVCGKCGSDALEFKTTTPVAWCKEKQDFINTGEGVINGEWTWCHACKNTTEEVWKNIEGGILTTSSSINKEAQCLNRKEIAPHESPKES